ncbi:hypothetical protein DNTS_020533 [Danionella cerebrum]|uniref:Uncharacterized protein n=1 Tax=Danionella cerebrum TaxID=2873325 RepID=A0A553QA56_9TELE|nr:hypothetical protein DNTS_020533 [Danionella translucida]
MEGMEQDASSYSNMKIMMPLCLVNPCDNTAGFSDIPADIVIWGLPYGFGCNVENDMQCIASRSRSHSHAERQTDMGGNKRESYIQFSNSERIKRTTVMERKGNMRRATSAGYRLPDRPNGPLASKSSVSVFRNSVSRTQNTGETPVNGNDIRDVVKQDQVWRELVRAERTGVKEWEKNWSFMMNFDQLGHPRNETPLPSSVSFYSDRLPNTTNQTFGSRLYTDMGKELIQLDNLLMLTANHRKAKRNPEMQPC